MFDNINGVFKMHFLPFNKGYDEHPYWQIMKLEIILDVINLVQFEENKNKK